MNKKTYLIGNAHLDPVWLWQWQEGFAEIKATFKSALDRMNEFDDFQFVSACSCYYMWIEASDKKMFAEIQRRVKEKRWHIVGGWFLQPDCNLPSGESFARHALSAQRYFKEKFGITSHTGYNVDSFGHNGSLPKILKNSGMDNYVFMRPNFKEKDLPQSLFNWKSMDGSTVKAYRLPIAYNLQTTERIKDIHQMDEPTPLMAFFGVGNHGGGATIELLDSIKKDLDENFVISNPDKYFEDTKNLAVPVVEDDLQYHAKGCYSACSQIKEANYVAENELINTEKYSVLSEKLINTTYPHSELERAWRNVLFNQFHDILGGCCIKEGIEDAVLSYGESINICKTQSNFALQQISWNIDTMDGKELTPYRDTIEAGWKSDENIGTPVVIFNPLPYSVTRLVSVRATPEFVTDNSGNVIPHQLVRDSKTNGTSKFATAFTADVPAYGYCVYRMYFSKKSDAHFDNPFICTQNSIENNKIRLVINEATGEVSSLFDKVNGIELLKGTSTLFLNEKKYDTWAHYVSEFDEIIKISEKGSVKLIENGPERATLRSKIKMYNTTIIRDYSLEKESDTVVVKAKVNFQEKHKMLKFSFDVNASQPKTHTKIPFGYIERPADGSEQVGGEWTAIYDDKAGLCIATGSKRSFDVKNNKISFTVLRGAVYADHMGMNYRDEFCEYMDQGQQCFEYSLAPFKTLSDCQKQSELIANPLTVVVETFHHGSLPTEYSGIHISENNIVLTAIKKHEDSDALILRLYEAENKDTTAKIKIFDKEFSAEFSHNQVKTFIVDKASVRECDFMEWDKS